MFNPRKLLAYYGKILLAAAVLFGLLLALAIAAELYTALSGGQVSPEDPLQMFSLPGVRGRLIRDMLPGVLAVGAAFFLASNFVASLYALEGRRDAAGHLWRCIFGQPSFSPYVRVSEGEVKTDGDHVLMRMGGPANVLTTTNSAVVLERGGRLTRVLGPGKLSPLEPFEKVRHAIDVRPMRWEYEVKALSKEGIPVTLAVDVNFQVDTGGQEPTDQTPYPVLEEAIFKASISQWMRRPGGSEDDQYFDWARRVVIGETEGTLRSIVARYPLDALVGLQSLPKSSAENPRKDIERELTEALRKSATNLGAQVNYVRLGAIKVDDRVTEQWIEAWRDEWRYWAMVQEKTGEATREQLREVARAQAQVDMITAMAGALQRSISRGARLPSRLLIMRLIEVFDRSTVGPYTYLPKQAIETLDRLRELVG